MKLNLLTLYCWELLQNILAYSKITPKYIGLKQQKAFIILHNFSHSGIQETHSWVILSQQFSSVCNQDFDQGCTHLQAWLELENLLLWCLVHMVSKWVLSVTKRPQFLTCVLHRAPWASSRDDIPASSRVSAAKESKEESTIPLMTLSRKSYTIISATFYSLEVRH